MPSSRKMTNSPKKSEKTSETQEHLLGSTVVGERGQVVIPKDIRDRLRLKPGDKLMVMVHKNGPIMLVPVEQMQRMIRQMSEQMSSLLAKS
jgi:AbrB family looped-hinge helix DNA binding protein